MNIQGQLNRLHFQPFTYFSKFSVDQSLNFRQFSKECEEGVKWELGFALFFSGKMGLALLGLGCLQLRVEKDKYQVTTQKSTPV